MRGRGWQRRLLGAVPRRVRPHDLREFDIVGFPLHHRISAGRLVGRRVVLMRRRRGRVVTVILREREPLLLMLATIIKVVWRRRGLLLLLLWWWWRLLWRLLMRWWEVLRPRKRLGGMRAVWRG